MNAAEKVRKQAVDLYGQTPLADAILGEVDRLKTGERIANGELVLPHPIDAQRWHDRLTGKADMTETDQRNTDVIGQLQKRIEAMERELSIPPAPPPPGPVASPE